MPPPPLQPLLALAAAVMLHCHIELGPHGFTLNSVHTGSCQWCADRGGPPEREKKKGYYLYHLKFLPWEISSYQHDVNWLAIFLPV